ncbi:hypothetical protein AB3X94_24355 [Paraburkholderia sp. BR10923]|uniref:hypothetical protein n=1 Tax=Paraburkholderia sp. BR10923 TaxID=3236992 RepID=UPI0034CFB6BD
MSAVFDTSSGNGKDAARELLAVRIVRGSTAHDVFLHKNPQGEPLYYSKDGVSTGPAFERPAAEEGACRR